jgi:hypothetical protein
MIEDIVSGGEREESSGSDEREFDGAVVMDHIDERNAAAYALHGDLNIYQINMDIDGYKQYCVHSFILPPDTDASTCDLEMFKRQSPNDYYIVTASHEDGEDRFHCSCQHEHDTANALLEFGSRRCRGASSLCQHAKLIDRLRGITVSFAVLPLEVDETHYMTHTGKCPWGEIEPGKVYYIRGVGDDSQRGVIVRPYLQHKHTSKCMQCRFGSTCPHTRAVLRAIRHKTDVAAEESSSDEDIPSGEEEVGDGEDEDQDGGEPEDHVDPLRTTDKVSYLVLDPQRWHLPIRMAMAHEHDGIYPEIIRPEFILPEVCVVVYHTGK